MPFHPLLWQLLADAAPAGALDGIPGAPAWVGTGLLGGVLGWLLFVHLPNKDKQIKELIADHNREMREKDERHDVHTTALTSRFNETMSAVVSRFSDQEKERRADFRESLAAIVAHCEKETSQVGDSLRQLMEDVRQELRRSRGGGGPPS